MHEQFRELSALATSGCLTAEERRELHAHLEICADCRQVFAEFDTVAQVGLTSLISGFPADVTNVPPEWNEENAAQRFFARIENEIASDSHRFESAELGKRKSVKEQPQSNVWRGRFRTLLPYVAGVTCAAAVGLWAYQIGAKRGADLARNSQQRSDSAVIAAREQVAAISQDRQELYNKLDEGGKVVARLNQKIGEELAEIERLKTESQQLRDSLQKTEVEKATTTSERDALNHRLEQVQLDLGHVQTDMAQRQMDLDALQQQRTNEVQHAAQLEAQVARMSEALKDRNDTIDEQRELLARDRDIRDLMGARDLYVAEVFDVGRNGETKKPFGRVFYNTKGKSLIFYAYNLDQRPEVRNASTFQAWGRRGPDLAQAKSLGIFYMDSASHKRWILKFNDSKSLEQIDAVFVTVEPNGGSQKPSGKEFLFTYLKVEPNHP